ncbi:MAG TPA: helix-turn-helix domain-containing protein [Ktedonobacterales bacterium]|nr:helix-turn-helix domain-containing protein [Ktedonobacterales bacterium]
MGSDDYLTVSEAAQFAEVSPRTVYRWIDEGRLAAFLPRRGRGRRVQREELERLATDIVPLARGDRR